MATSKNIKETDINCKSIFEKIITRQISALMFHDEMADLYDFLGLAGFKRLHEYQYFCESAEYKSLKRYFLNHHNMLLSIDEPVKKEYIPNDWKNYSRFDVNSQLRRQYVEKTMIEYWEWEKETKCCLECWAKELLDMGMVADFEIVGKLVSDVDKELKCLERLVLKLKAVDFDPAYIVESQPEIHEKYKKKTKHLGIDIH